jgi:5,10-methenyltetrahydromethanopterin hydrogenase
MVHYFDKLCDGLHMGKRVYIFVKSRNIIAVSPLPDRAFTNKQLSREMGTALSTDKLAVEIGKFEAPVLSPKFGAACFRAIGNITRDGEDVLDRHTDSSPRSAMPKLRTKHLLGGGTAMLESLRGITLSIFNIATTPRFDN